MLKHAQGREALALYAATLLITFILVRLEAGIGWLGGYLLLLVAATFVYLPIYILRRAGEDPAALGIHDQERGRALRVALLIMLITFPPYLIGFHGWQTLWLEQTPTFEAERLPRWPYELEGRPLRRNLDEGEIRLHTYKEGLRLRWRLEPGARFEAELYSAGLVVLDAKAFTRASGERLSIKGGSRGVVDFEAPSGALRLDARVDDQRVGPDRLLIGRARLPAGESPFRAEQDWLWILNLILTQFILVAIPEELFYRGYLQTRLDGLVGRDRLIFGVPVNVTSVVLSSALFAVGHVVTIPSPQRLAVFFPSLLFGWMRRASGGILAPALYHAACNILVEIAARFYV